MAALSAAAMSDAVESVFLDGWTNAPALRAVPEERRERLESALESLLASHDRTRAVVSGEARVVALGGIEPPGATGDRDPVTPPREKDGGTSSSADAFAALDAVAIPDAVLSEHFGFLKMLHRQLLNAVADFQPGTNSETEFAYDGEGTLDEEATTCDARTNAGEQSAGERADQNQTRRERVTVPRDGLSRRALEAVADAARWIDGVSEGASRVHRVTLASCAPPDAWVDARVPTNAKDAVGVHLYNDLNENGLDFDPEKVADAEGFFGKRAARRWNDRFFRMKRSSAVASTSSAPAHDASSGSRASKRSSDGADLTFAPTKTNSEASRLLDVLERAGHAWRVKKQNQLVLDSLKTIHIDATAVVTLGLVRSPSTGRVKDITRRVANAAALSETVRQRYPAAPLTSLQLAKLHRIRGDDADVAVAALEAFSRCLAAVATALQARAADVVRAHRKIARGGDGDGTGNGAMDRGGRRGGAVGEDETLLETWRRASRETGEWLAVTGRRVRADMEAVTGVRVVDVKNVACCGVGGDDSRRLEG